MTFGSPARKGFDYRQVERMRLQLTDEARDEPKFREKWFPLGLGVYLPASR